MKTDCLAFNQDRIKGLDAQPVECRRTVQEHRVFLDDLFKYVPHLGPLALDHLLGAFDCRCISLFFKFIEDKGFEQLQRHLLRQAALMELEIGTDDDHGTARIIHALAEKVLAETSLFAFEHVRE